MLSDSGFRSQGRRGPNEAYIMLSQQGFAFQDLEGQALPAAMLTAVDSGTGICDPALEAEEGARPICHRMLSAVASEQFTLDVTESTPTAAVKDEDTLMLTLTMMPPTTTTRLQMMQTRRR